MAGSSVGVLATRQFATHFRDCLARGPQELKIVSPFITAFPPYKRTSDFCVDAIKRGVSKILIVTRPPESDVATLTKIEADLLVNNGVDLRIRTSPTLHSKIYVFLYEANRFAAFVGSANFTKGGFVDNDETVTFIQKLDDRLPVFREIERLEKQGAFPYSHWKTQSTR